MKNAFLKWYLNEEDFIEHPKGFIDACLQNHVYKLKKDLYGLNQAPRSWYERLVKFLTRHGYVCGGSDKTIFVNKDEGKLMISQIYVDYIVFGGILSKMLSIFFNK